MGSLLPEYLKSDNLCCNGKSACDSNQADMQLSEEISLEKKKSWLDNKYKNGK